MGKNTYASFNHSFLRCPFIIVKHWVFCKGILEGMLLTLRQFRSSLIHKKFVDISHRLFESPTKNFTTKPVDCMRKILQETTINVSTFTPKFRECALCRKFMTSWVELKNPYVWIRIPKDLLSIWESFKVFHTSEFQLEKEKTFNNW